MKRRTENNDLIPAVLTALAHMPEVFAFSVKAEARKGQRRIVPKGTADILGVVCCRVVFAPEVSAYGRGLAIETKASHRDACKCDSCVAQRDFRTDWESRGGLYLKVRTVEEVIVAIRGRAAA